MFKNLLDFETDSDLIFKLEELSRTYTENKIKKSQGLEQTRIAPLTLSRQQLIKIVKNQTKLQRLNVQTQENRIYVYGDICLKLSEEACKVMEKKFPGYLEYDSSKYVNNSLMREAMGDGWVKTFSNIKLTELPIQLIEVKDSLRGNCAGVIIGYVYHYYKDYKPFNELSNEDIKLVLKNLLTFTRKFNEFLENGIIYADCKPANVLYKDEDVQIIDLDSDVSVHYFNPENYTLDGFMNYYQLIKSILKSCVEKGKLTENQYIDIYSDFYNMLDKLKSKSSKQR